MSAMKDEEQLEQYREFFKSRLIEIDQKLKELYDKTYFLIPSLK